ncbi:SH3 domain-containing protein [Algoriphagus aestuarii]|nr:SH3 domain-containing protein [Algoriphagus aestuarii]
MIIIILVILLILLLFLGIKVFKWTLKSKWRIQVFLILLAAGVIGIGIQYFFFRNMQFIQSEVYPNLYLVNYPDKDYSVVEEAIKEKIKEHLMSEFKTGKPLSYTGEKAIYFYELGGMTFGFIGEAGTGYFIDHEEDLGGFVSEELGMYQDYRLAEFYYEPCPRDNLLVCGEINFFREGEYVKLETLKNLSSVHLETQDLPDSVNQTNNPIKLPFHGVLDIETVATYYPEILTEFDSIGNFFAQRIPISNNRGSILSLLRHTYSYTDYFLYAHDEDFQSIDFFYLGKAMDFDNGKSVTIDYEIIADTSISFNKVVYGSILRNKEESIDTIAHEITTIQINKNGTLGYTISKNPNHYAMEVYDKNSDFDGIKLRDKPNGSIIQTLETTGNGYIISIVNGEKGWFRVLKIESIDEGELTIPQGLPWIHHSDIGIRANRETSVFDTPKNGKQIGVVPIDTDLNMIDSEQDWVKIEYQGLTGWVDSKSLCGNPVTTCS